MDDFKLAALKTGRRKYDVIRDDPRYAELEPSLPDSWEEPQRELDIVTTVEQCNLLQRIYSGELWAIGSKTLESGFDELHRVPRELFFVDIDENGPFHDGVYWAKGELTVDDHSYFDIRIVQAPDMSKESEISVEREQSKRRKGGRPNTRNTIEKMIRNLLKDERFQAMRRRDQAVEVRVAILGEESRDQHNRPNYMTDTIARIIGEIDKS